MDAETFGTLQPSAELVSVVDAVPSGATYLRSLDLFVREGELRWRKLAVQSLRVLEGDLSVDSDLDVGTAKIGGTGWIVFGDLNVHMNPVRTRLHVRHGDKRDVDREIARYVLIQQHRFGAKFRDVAQDLVRPNDFVH